MPAEPRELLPSEQLEVAKALAAAAQPAGVTLSLVLPQLDVPLYQLNLTGTALTDWHAAVQALHNGVSAKAGYRADAVARLVDAAGDLLPGNRGLAELLHRLAGPGVGAQTSAATRSIFLSYASTDRDAVDRCHDALAAALPGVALFQDWRCIALGQDWLQAIRGAAGSASTMLCWVTPAYLGRTFCSYEIGIAEHQGGRLIPLWIDGLDPNTAPAYLSGRQGHRLSAPHDCAAIAAALMPSQP
jgi:hypothetical protein